MRTKIWKVMALGGLLAGSVVVSSPVAHATSTFAFTRVAGGSNGLTPDRYGTAAAIAETAFANAATAIVATGENFPDALAASYIAGQGTGSPILLTTPSAPVPASTMAALQAMKVKTVILLGGTSAVGLDVETSLQSSGYSVTRIQGTSRYDTMQQVDTRQGDTVGQVGGVNTAILATGENFPDALGGGPLAYARNLPLVLTNGTMTNLSTQAVNVLQARAIKHVIALGGAAAVNPAQLAQLQTMGITVDATATTGPNRSATAALLATDEVDNLGFANTTLGVANGLNPSSATGFSPDALAGAPLGGQRKAPTLITASPNDPGASCQFVTPLAATEATGLAYGGTSALTTAVLQAIATCAGAGGQTAAHLYVPNLKANTVTLYTASASGDATPAATLGGAATGLNGPNAVALASDGSIFVANITNNSVTIYAPGATGNATPTATIVGAATGLAAPDGIGIGPGGRIFVANSGNNSVTAYARTATGNAAPVVTISGGATLLKQPSDLFVTATGAVLVTNFGGDSVTEYAPGATGNVAPAVTIVGSNTGLSGPSGLASLNDRIAVTNITNNTVTEYGPGASGNVAPIATLFGANTGLSQPNGVAFGPGAGGTIDVANFAANSITEYAFGQTGNVAPATTIKGPSTGLDQPGPPAFG